MPVVDADVANDDDDDDDDSDPLQAPTREVILPLVSL